MASTPRDDFPVVLTAGSLRADPANGWLVPHAWTDAGVVIEAPPNGAGVLHVAVALCVLNDTFREGRDRGLDLSGVRVSARGEFDDRTWQSTGVTYALEVDSRAGDDEVAALVARVDEVAEVPRALRAGMTVQRADG
jgi:OsmC-like protein